MEMSRWMLLILRHICGREEREDGEGVGRMKGGRKKRGRTKQAEEVIYRHERTNFPSTL